ncbi:hypothetical protein Nepgr_033561 [Nepenthes gracilis]|uniref:Uncharacterized protein n=1 Tax=Nepenthes gracilis TaxID=150966 RepID=A0AAD3TLN6_NEPGR|nr:hypothetical protein Nepgr_033561 [Nepenthes gracilis]
MVVAAFGYAVNAGLESMLLWLSFPVFALSLLGSAGMDHCRFHSPIGPGLYFSEDSTTRLCGRGSETSAAGVASAP